MLSGTGYGLLAQATAEGIGIGAVSTGGLGLLVLLIKRGVHVRQIDIGEQAKETNGHGKPCPLHEPLVKMLDERETNRQRDHKETVDSVNALRTSMEAGFVRLYQRMDKT